MVYRLRFIVVITKAMRLRYFFIRVIELHFAQFLYSEFQVARKDGALMQL